MRLSGGASVVPRRDSLVCTVQQLYVTVNPCFSALIGCSGWWWCCCLAGAGQVNSITAVTRHRATPSQPPLQQQQLLLLLIAGSDRTTDFLLAAHYNDCRCVFCLVVFDIVDLMRPKVVVRPCLMTSLAVKFAMLCGDVVYVEFVWSSWVSVSQLDKMVVVSAPR